MATTTQNVANTKDQTISALQKAYSMEMETVANYLADSVNLEGVRAEEIKKSLAADIQEELGHAQRLAERMKQLGGFVPGPAELELENTHMDASVQTTDVEHVIRAVLDSERAAIGHYKQIIRDTDGEDYVTQGLCIELLADEEKHFTQFDGFLKEYTAP